MFEAQSHSEMAVVDHQNMDQVRQREGVLSVHTFAGASRALFTVDPGRAQVRPGWFVSSGRRTGLPYGNIWETAGLRGWADGCQA